MHFTNWLVRTQSIGANGWSENCNLVHAVVVCDGMQKSYAIGLLTGYSGQWNDFAHYLLQLTANSTIMIILFRAIALRIWVMDRSPFNQPSNLNCLQSIQPIQSQLPAVSPITVDYPLRPTNRTVLPPFECNNYHGRLLSTSQSLFSHRDDAVSQVSFKHLAGAESFGRFSRSDAAREVAPI